MTEREELVMRLRERAMESDRHDGELLLEAAAAKLPETHVMVPVEPTDAMLAALTQEWHPSKRGNIKERYAAMLRAAKEGKWKH